MCEHVPFGFWGDCYTCRMLPKLIKKFGIKPKDIFFTKEEFLKRVKTSKKGDVLLWDERGLREDSQNE